MKLSLFIDQKLCIGCGICSSKEPNIFAEDDDGFAFVMDIKQENINVEVIELLIKECPTMVIKKGIQPS